ncbi:amino acid transporter [Apiospora arundinis]
MANDLSNRSLERGENEKTDKKPFNTSSDPSDLAVERSEETTTAGKKPFTTLSAIGNGYGITNTAVGILLTLGTTLDKGGSPLLFWGFLLMTLVGLATAVTLAELCSAMPHPGGQYIWTNQLAPASYRRFLSYATAVLGWMSAVLIGASANLSVMLGIASLVGFLRPEFVYRRWMGFVGFQILNVLTCVAACFRDAQPRISKGVLLLSCTTIVTLSITLFAMARPENRPTSTAFFGTVVNESGWPNGIAFLIGLNGPNWSFSCLDVAVHLAEEIPQPGRNIPKALLWTIAVGFCSGMFVILAILTNLPSIDGLADNSALTVIYRITNSKGAAVGLWIPVLIVTTSAVWSIHTWQARLAWTLSREAGVPLHRHLSWIAPAPFHTPIWSMIGSATGTAILGCLYLGSEVAFSSFTATGILLQYLSYSIPVVLVLSRGRSSFQHGSFWYPKLGLVANLVMVSWSLVALVFYCFPNYLPIVVGQMNYSSVILVATPILILSMWFLHAKKRYEVKEV